MKLAAPPSKLAPPHWEPVPLSCDRSVASRDNAKAAPGFDAAGRSLPAEMLPAEIPYAGIRFRLAPADGPNAVVARGQTVSLPAGPFTRLYVLAASADGDQKATFRVGDKPVALTIQDWTGYIGQWDNRTWKKIGELPRRRPGVPPWPQTLLEYTGLMPGFIKRAPVAWFASHRHTADGANEPYAYSYLFAYSVQMPPNARTLTLPDNDKIRVLAVTVAEENESVHPAHPLYDTLERPGT